MLDLKALLNHAGRMGASDVHLTVGVSPRIRVHGVLQATDFPKMTSADTLEVLLAVVNPQQRDFFDEEGELDTSVTISGAGRYRVNAFRQRGCISIAFRLVDMEIPAMDELELPQSVKLLCNKPKGLIIVGGPSGAGKSTVLASMINYINESSERHIITLEDPIEYLHTHKKSIVSQREIGLDTKSYIKGITSAMREDPNVILLGAIESAEVAAKAFMAAQTGRLVLTSAYTADVSLVLEAVISLFKREDQEMAKNQLANCLEGIITRELCRDTNGERVPATGILLPDRGIKSLIRQGEFAKIAALPESEYMTSLDACLKRLYDAGRISLDTLLSGANDPEAMQLKLTM